MYLAPELVSTTQRGHLHKCMFTMGRYMESDFREQVMTPALEKFGELVTDPQAMYVGNRVYDEL